jgi:hypothetical protein
MNNKSERVSMVEVILDRLPKKPEMGEFTTEEEFQAAFRYWERMVKQMLREAKRIDDLLAAEDAEQRRGDDGLN